MNLEQYFKETIEEGASDLHLVEGSIPAIRINGQLKKFDVAPIPYGELRFAVFSLLDKDVIARFKRKKDIDLSMDFFEHRFRLNLHYQGGRVGLAARLIPKDIPSPDSIDFTEVIYKMTHLNDGLILVTGPSGVGKSTTLAAMINIINKERKAHIITIEDPIEYIFKDEQSIVEQRQLGRDTPDFASALKFALRQDPNVIMVGEMRDRETINAALTAAKTGHLVLSTLHTTTAAETIERVIDFFPPEYQSQISSQFASVLRAVISQQLLPKISEGRIAAREIMINNNAIASMIRTGRAEQIYSVIESSAQEGMITMNKAISNLCKRNLISEDVAHNRKRDLGTRSIYY